MGRFALRLELKPQVALVGGDDLQPGWFARNSQVTLGAFLGKRSGPSLPELLVHQTYKEDFRFPGSVAFAREFEECRKESGHRSLGIAGPSAVHFSVFDLWAKILLGGRHDIQVRGEHDRVSSLSNGFQPGDQILSAWQDGLSANLDPFRPSQVLEESGDPFLSG